jgi:hypothetical protein
MFTLCIPTMNRFDSFLKDFIPKYLSNPLVNEIIITDETGEDFEKITNTYNDSKLRVFKNEQRLGPFLNKWKALNLATGDWIVLMDSDNFADVDYFTAAKQFIETNQLKQNTVLMPSWARPLHSYKDCPPSFSKHNTSISTAFHLSKCMNTGNYILSSDLVKGLNIEKELPQIPYSSACDVIYFNTLLLEQFPNLTFYIVNDMEYDHATHEGSIYLQTHNQFQGFNQYVHRRFYQLFQ